MSDFFGHLRPHLRTGKKIQIERNRPSNQLLNGYLMGLSQTLGLMHCFDDFEPDGYTVFRLCDVIEVCSSEYERHWDRMLAEEGLLDGLSKTLDVSLEDVSVAIRSVDQQFGRMIIECEDDEDDIEDFYIGQLASMNESEVEFDHFDALGRWKRTPASILLEDITLIQFETPYIKIFGKYLTGNPTSVSRDAHK